jgi:hypothetical protein
MIEYAGTRQADFRARLLEVLDAMAEMMPGMVVSVEVWRPAIVDHSGYADEQVEVWVRVDENVPGFRFQTRDRWFELGVGIVRQNWDWLILPDGLSIKTDDHVIIQGDVFMVSESEEQGGVFRCKLNSQMTRFVRPPRSAPTYRQLGMKASIV